jgi:hypothetical protein
VVPLVPDYALLTEKEKKTGGEKKRERESVRARGMHNGPRVILGKKT